MSTLSSKNVTVLPDTPPVLSLNERDRRWRGLQVIMERRELSAIIVGSFRSRELYESYLIDDFLDSVVLLPQQGEAIVLTIAPGRVSRILESARRGVETWASNIRIGSKGSDVAQALQELGIASQRIGVVGFGPTAPGEVEGIIPLGFWNSLTKSAPEAKFEDFTQDFTDFVLIKSEEEIALLRHAAKISDLACESMVEASRPGVSEAVVYAEIMRTIYANGCGVRYPYLSLQSGPDNISWGAPQWLFRAESPRTLCAGDLVQAEIHTCYGGQEAQVQMSVALDPVDDEIRRCEDVAHESYDAGLAAVKPGATFGEVVAAMAEPISRHGCWSKTPLLHTLTFGSTGFTPVNREQVHGTREEWLEGKMRPGVRRPDLVLKPGMGLELEPNACIGMKRVNVGAGVLVTETGYEELNSVPTRVRHTS